MPIAPGAAASSMEDAGRELMWNLGTFSHWLMYILFGVSLVIFAIGLRRRIRAWRAGKPCAETFGDWGRRLWILVREVLAQRQTRRRFLPGLFHSLIFYSFLVLVVTTLIVMIDMDFGLKIYHGPFYLGVTLAADLAGGLLLLGLVVAAVRRYLAHPEFLPRNERPDAVILALLGFLVLSGFLAEGARIALHPAGDPWRAYSPIGSLFSGLFAAGVPGGGRTVYVLIWWLHALGTFTMVALVPYTKFFHMLSIPTNQLLSKLAAPGSLTRVDIEALFAAEDAEEDLALGVGATGQLTWKQRLDLDACIDCGRCDEACPARAAGQALSPRSLIADLEMLLKGGVGSGAEKGVAEGTIHGAGATVFADPNFIWHCRTCHACQAICPAAIGHVDLFTELRRAEVMMEGRLPKEAGQALKTMETQGNPFGAQAERTDWIAELGIPVIAPGEETEILLWFGCAVTFDPEKRTIAEDLVAILRHTGVPFGHLGAEETCCGDPARILGDENLFQATAKQTVAALQKRRFQTLLVLCPHGANVFRHEYPQFGGHFTVRHHSELLAEWLRAGRLAPSTPLAQTVTYHDACYLGRYQGLYDAPRDVLRAIPGLRLREMRHARAESFCCGAGGGHFWMDLDSGEQRTYTLRVDEARAVEAETIAVACPFCQQMLTDGLKGRDLDERMKVRDLASLLRESLGL